MKSQVSNFFGAYKKTHTVIKNEDGTGKEILVITIFGFKLKDEIHEKPLNMNSVLNFISKK